MRYFCRFSPITTSNTLKFHNIMKENKGVVWRNMPILVIHILMLEQSMEIQCQWCTGKHLTTSILGVRAWGECWLVASANFLVKTLPSWLVSSYRHDVTEHGVMKGCQQSFTYWLQHTLKCTNFSSSPNLNFATHYASMILFKTKIEIFMSTRLPLIQNLYHLSVCDFNQEKYVIPKDRKKMARSMDVLLQADANPVDKWSDAWQIRCTWKCGVGLFTEEAVCVLDECCLTAAAPSWQHRSHCCCKFIMKANILPTERIHSAPLLYADQKWSQRQVTGVTSPK